ncbi:F-box protein CPR1-like [Silene latifolia]|uniref:F-box protein CPR1-like n=1 Tax=Silene latifolia TaxID=37657 RepID=UPI003D773668
MARSIYSKKGFAFDPVNHDFKVVGFTDQRNNEGIDTRITKVYSLNANSCTTLDTEFPTDSVVGWHRHGVVINYYLVHWMFWNPSLRKLRIGCFDVCKMKWIDDVLLPRYYYHPTCRNFLLDFGVLDGLLCYSFENKVDSCFDVWVMMEYGVQDSWFKLFSIPISNNLHEGVIPVASRNRSAEVLIRQRHTSKFYWYDRADGRMSEAKFDGVPISSYFETYMCSRSMVELPCGRLFDNR